MQPKAIRDGFHSLTPYLLAIGASRLIEKGANAPRTNSLRVAQVGAPMRAADR